MSLILLTTAFMVICFTGNQLMRYIDGTPPTNGQRFMSVFSLVAFLMTLVLFWGDL